MGVFQIGVSVLRRLYWGVDGDFNFGRYSCGPELLAYAAQQASALAGVD